MISLHQQRHLASTIFLAQNNWSLDDRGNLANVFRLHRELELERTEECKQKDFHPDEKLSERFRQLQSSGNILLNHGESVANAGSGSC